MSGPGKVNFRNLKWNEFYQRTRRIRWRQLRSRTIPSDLKTRSPTDTGPVYICIFGYGAWPDNTPNTDGGGPWFGYTKEMLNDAPCTHCGRTKVFGGATWDHECPGKYQGVRLPCQDPHPCKGEPSMATAPSWRHADWVEVPFNTPTQEAL